MGDDIAGLIRHLGVAQADLMGYSMGAGAALQAAIPGLIFNADNTWGSPTGVVNTNGTLTGPQAGDVLTIAKKFITQTGRIVGGGGCLRFQLAAQGFHVLIRLRLQRGRLGLERLKFALFPVL